MNSSRQISKYNSKITKQTNKSDINNELKKNSSKTLQDHEKQMNNMNIIKYQFPASIQKAFIHRRAKKIGYLQSNHFKNCENKLSIKNQQPYCLCCNKLKPQEILCSDSTLPSDNTNQITKNENNNKSTFKFNSSGALFFSFIRMTIVYLILMFLLCGLYNIFTSLDGIYCLRKDLPTNHSKQSLCIDGFFTKFSTYNKKGESQKLYTIYNESILCFIGIILSIGFFMNYRRIHRQIHDKIDLNQQTQDDYSIFIQNIPTIHFQKQSNKKDQLNNKQTHVQNNKQNIQDIFKGLKIQDILPQNKLKNKFGNSNIQSPQKNTPKKHIHGYQNSADYKQLNPQQNLYYQCKSIQRNQKKSNNSNTSSPRKLRRRTTIKNTHGHLHSVENNQQHPQKHGFSNFTCLQQKIEQIFQNQIIIWLIQIIQKLSTKKYQIKKVTIQNSQSVVFQKYDYIKMELNQNNQENDRDNDNDNDKYQNKIREIEITPSLGIIEDDLIKFIILNMFTQEQFNQSPQQSIQQFTQQPHQYTIKQIIIKKLQLLITQADIVTSTNLCYSLKQFQKINRQRQKIMEQYIQLHYYNVSHQNDNHKELIQGLNQLQIDLCKQFIKRESVQHYAKYFIGKAFMSFQLQHYRQYIIQLTDSHPSRIQFKNKSLSAKRAQHPTDINWHNMSLSKIQRIQRIFFSYMIIALIITVSGAILILADHLKTKQDQNYIDYLRMSRKNELISQKTFFHYFYYIGISVFTYVINYIISLVIQRLNQYQRHKSLTHKFISRIVKTLIAQFINTALLLYFIDLVKHRPYLSRQGLVQRASYLILVNGLMTIIWDGLGVSYFINFIYLCYMYGPNQVYNNIYGYKKEDDEKEADEKEVNEKEVNEKEGDKKEVNEKEGDKKEGDKKEVDEKEGDKKEGDKKEGDKKEGDKKEGDKKEGDKKQKDQVSTFQIKLNKDLQLPIFNIANRYSKYLLLIYTSMFYFYLIPLGVPFTACVLACKYWIDKVYMVKYCSEYNQIGYFLSKMVLQIFEGSILIFAIGNFIFRYSVQLDTHRNSLDIISISISFIYVFFMLLTPNGLGRRLFTYQFEKTPYSKCEERGMFSETYWKQNPATYLIDEQKMLIFFFKDQNQNLNNQINEQVKN